MTAPHADQLIDGYLARLNAAAADLPKSARQELIDDMRSHIAEARAREPQESDATVLNILDRLGEPGVVLAEARERLGIRPAAPFHPGLLEIAAVFLVLLLWPIGVVLLWTSRAWNSRDKLIGTLLPLLGYIGLYVGTRCGPIFDPAGHVVGNRCIGGSEGAGMLDALLTLVTYGAPVLGTAYLAVRLRLSRQRLVAAA